MLSTSIDAGSATLPLQTPISAGQGTEAPKLPNRPPRLRIKPTSLQASSSAAYAKDLRAFVAWGGTIPCDTATLLKYIRAQGKRLSPPTIYRSLMAIRHGHQSQGFASPTDDATLRPVLRNLQLGYLPGKPTSNEASAGTVGKRRERKSARPLTRAMLLRMLDAMGRNSLDRRDRAALLIGFMGALKRGELVALNVDDITFTADAMLAKVKGRQVAVPATGGELCAAAAVKAWIEHAGLDMEQPPGALFRRFDRGGDPTSDRLDSAWISVLVKQRLNAVGIDPKPYSAQSLRSGRLLEAAKGVL